ncbi:ribonuclease H-like domain-containing protein [Tanacetum coccineum]
MTDFVPGRVVFDAAQRKRGKYMTKCADIGYEFLPFSFSSLGELEADAVTLLKRIRKFSIAQDIGARAAIHIFNRISFAIAKGRVSKTIGACAGISKLYFAMRTCPSRVFVSAQLSFDMALRSALERVVTTSGPGFGDWQWRLATLPFAFGGLGVYSAGEMALWQSQKEDHTSDWLRVVPISRLGQTMNGKTYRCVLCYRLGVPIFSVSKPCSACSKVFTGDIYRDHAVSCVGIIGIKHRHNVGEYDIWAMKMEHYLAHTDYPIWEVIQNGNGPVSITTDTSGQIKVLPPRTAEEIVARERERKARTTLLMALPEDHLAKFHKMTDAKEMWDAIKSRFGGNDESKKMQKYILKQQFEGFSCPQLVHETWKQIDEYDLKKCLEVACGHDLKRMTKVLQEGLIGQTISARWKIMLDGLATNQTQTQRYDGILSYENEVLQSVFMNKESEIENQPLYDRFVTAEGMHAVPPPMTGNYMPSGPDVEVDDSKFTYGPKQTQPNESESQSSEFDTCESNISAEPSELVSEPVVNESNVKSQPKVWSDAPIIEEYESDSDDECVVIPTKQQETPSFANQQVKTPRENVKNQSTHSQKPKVDKKDLGYGFAVRACFVCGSLNHLIRDCNFHEKRMARKADLNNGWNNVQRVNKQNQFVPSAVLTRTGIIPVNTARTSGTKIFSTARPANVFIKTHSSSTRPFKKTTVLRLKFSNQKFNTAKDYPHRALKNKGIVDSGCFRHMTWNKVYLDEFQDFNGGPCYFWRIEKLYHWSKGIKREYSNARTPQQNGVAERKNRPNRCCYDHASDSFLPNTFWAESS